MNVILRAVVSVMALSIFIYGSDVTESGTEKLEFNTFVTDVWTEGVDVARVLWRDCAKKALNSNSTSVKQEHFSLLTKCMKKKTLRALDRTLNSDVISIAPGVHLVKYEQLDKEGNVLKPSVDGNTLSNTTQAEIDYNGDWKYMVLNRMEKVFNTHVIKFELKEKEDKPEIVESRHRRRHQMMGMMMFGIVSMGMILVPMGFQFLAVIGGKALLLAKLALILSSIQGLKKIATSPINYGLYSAYPAVEGHVEKRAQGSQPFPPNFIDETARNQERINYRYDSESKMWRPEVSRLNKRSYPVYPAYPGYEHYTPSAITHPDADLYGLGQTPTEIHAEYTIDMPLDKVHFKSNQPYIA